jgi:tyrosyl-tRNA synthetase
MTNPLDLLTERGFVQDVTDADELRELLASERVTFYYGADPTATSLHIGNLVGMMAMAWLQRAGHRPIAVAGGGTGRIGDPSDAGMLIDNHTWLGEMRLIEFLRDVGKHFSVNQMIARESVRRRLEEREHGISYTEFSYQLLQAYDFAHLFAAEGCRLQIGGSDQWGNITAGIDLTRRLHGGKVFGLVWPLVERSDGKKFSKSTGDAVWLAANETSPYAFYQWFFNVPDDDVGRFLRLFTFLPLAEIAALEAEGASDPAARAPQRALAREATRIVHGDEGLAAAERATAVLFGDDPFDELDERTLIDAFIEAPKAPVDRDVVAGGLGVLEAMVLAGAASSNGEARRLIGQGAVRVNNTPVADPTMALDRSHLLAGGTIVIRVGKKRYFLLQAG